MSLLQFEKRQSNEGTFPEAPGREQENLLTIPQVADELVEFVSAVDEIRIVNDLAKNERIFLRCHITLTSVTPNGVISKRSEFGSYADWRNAKWRKAG
jgi:hypothetical protein